MRTINEQIERLRDRLHTCYESIARKGGTLPPIGERNMTNLPDAVESVPQVVGAKLEELTITENGTYTPQEGVNGFSKVTAEFDMDGIIAPSTIAFGNPNKTTSLEVDSNYFELSKKIGIKYINSENLIDIENFFRKVRLRIYPPFLDEYICVVDLTSLDVSKVTNTTNAFSNFALDIIDDERLYQTKVSLIINIANWDFKSNIHSYFFENSFIFGWYNNTQSYMTLNRPETLKYIVNCLGTKVIATSQVPNFFGIQSLVYNVSMNDIIEQDLYVFKGLSKSATLVDVQKRAYIRDRESIRALINGIADLTGETTQTITIASEVLPKITEEDIAIATAKNWTITTY
jgi:hypothetical protein